MHDLFGVVGLLIERRDDRIGDDVVDEAGTGRTGKAGDSSRIGAGRKARMPGREYWEGHQVDGDIDPRAVDELCRPPRRCSA
jgi:hypothetical protein